MSPPFPLSVGSFLNRGFSIFGSDAGTFLGLTALFQAPAILLTFLGFMAPPGELAELIAAFAPGLTNLVFTPLAGAAIVFGVFQRLRGEPASFDRCLKTAIARWPPLVGLTILNAIAIMAGAMLCAIPGIVIACGLFVIVPVFIVEGTTVGDAFRRSWELTRDYKLTIFLLLVALLLLMLVFYVPIIAVAGFEELANSQKGFLSVAYDVLLSLVFGALTAVITGVTYHDLRLAKDDIEEEDLAAIFA